MTHPRITHVFHEELGPTVEIVPLDEIGVAAVFSQGAPGEANRVNEDAAAIFRLDQKSAVLAVADGVGGSKSGEKASRLAIQSLASTLKQHEDHNTRGRMLDGIEQANQSIIETGLGSASTLVAVELEGKTIRPYHVGDSFCLLCGQRGKVKLHTTAHSPVGYAVESGVLDEKEALFHEERHIVSNLLGSQEMHIEVGPRYTMAARDTLLLATDGLSDNLHTEEIVDIIRHRDFETVLSDLVAVAVKRMMGEENGHPSKPDDLTCILFRLLSEK